MIYSGSAVFKRYLLFRMKPQLPCQYYTSCLNTYREWLSYYFNFIQKSLELNRKKTCECLYYLKIWKHWFFDQSESKMCKGVWDTKCYQVLRTNKIKVLYPGDCTVKWRRIRRSNACFLGSRNNLLRYIFSKDKDCFWCKLMKPWSLLRSVDFHGEKRGQW